MLPWILLCLAAVAALLACEWRQWRGGVWLTKPLASAAFLGAALAAGALESGYGRTVFAGLVLAAAGDVLLIPRGRPALFRAGVLSFLAGHLAYGAAFIGLGWDLLWLTAAVAVLAAVAWLVLVWLTPYLPEELKTATYAYVLVISLMVAAAAAAVGAGADAAILLGALAFYFSDLSVARDRFVTAALSNRLWGLPLYYAAQLILAATTARPPLA